MEELQNPIVKWPFGAATILLMTAVGAQVFDIVNNLTIVDGSSVVATDNRTLDLTADPDLAPGARVIVKTTSTATEKLNPGTGVKGESITGVAGKTFVTEYVYDGSGFVQTGKSIQID
ncbi:hypothetical protein [Parabacteroides sp. AF17-28]|jgi:hypothetical protein|uniref:hypothetical protein n=1 Tax=Parabacteroides sp. AF17-28 TaxID=2292241 RepID=UPI000EFEE136|nr:hypothetical protein [Parabacteroides sp. AF17-28]RHR56600.1 hypothetical protein DWW90_12495 [Parabacteroides sp. AF17-28]